MTLRERLRCEWWWWTMVRRRELVEVLCWRLAWLLPRRIALLVFVRVYAATGDAPTDDYAKVYKAWEQGAGK
jgi:hypothetical protein